MSAAILEWYDIDIDMLEVLANHSPYYKKVYKFCWEIQCGKVRLSEKQRKWLKGISEKYDEDYDRIIYGIKKRKISTASKCFK